MKKQQRVTRSRQKRSLFPGVLNETSEKRPRKKAKVQQKVKAEAKPPATENSPTDYQYSDMDSSTHGIGSRYFYLCDDGSEYPVRILDPAENKNFSVKSNERIVVFEGYRKKFKTTVSELLPATDKRKARFQKEKRLKKEKQAHEKKRAKRAKALYGRITSGKGPFPQCNEPGTLFLQATRRVYFTKNNDTPVSISKKFGVPAGKIVYDNRLQHPTLQETSRLHPLTCIILPLEGTYRFYRRRISWYFDFRSNRVVSVFLLKSRMSLLHKILPPARMMAQDNLPTKLVPRACVIKRHVDFHPPSKTMLALYPPSKSLLQSAQVRLSPNNQMSLRPTKPKTLVRRSTTKPIF